MDNHAEAVQLNGNVFVASYGQVWILFYCYATGHRRPRRRCRAGN